LAGAEPLVKEARRVVAQDPDDHRGTADRDESAKQGEQETPPDPLVLPIRIDVEREYLTGEAAVAVAWPAAADAQQSAVLANPNTDIELHEYDLIDHVDVPTALTMPSNVL